MKLIDLAAKFKKKVAELTKTDIRKACTSGLVSKEQREKLLEKIERMRKRRRAIKLTKQVYRHHKKGEKNYGW